MKLTNAIKTNLIIYRIAQQQNRSYEEVRQSLQEALDAAWDAVQAPGNILAQEKWQKLFPGGRKPTVEEFITQLAAEAERKETIPSLQ